MVTTETATVYRGGGRRFFTKKAAFRSEAKARVRAKYPCDCEAGSFIDPPHDCGLHGDFFVKRVDRLAAWLMRRSKAEQDNQTTP